MTVLQVRGEGGGYIIEGLLQNGVWQFRRQDKSGWVDSFEVVLQQINSGWPMLMPIAVHPEFSQLIWQLVMRFHESEPLRASRIQDWLDVAVNGRRPDEED